MLAAIFGYGRGWFSGFSAFRRLPRKVNPVASAETSAEAEVEAQQAERSEHAQRAMPAQMPVFNELSKLVAVRILPDYGVAFPAEEMVLALRAAELRHGAYGIFHCLAADDPERIRFSVAGLEEPGSFDLSKLKESEYSGVSVFTVLPCDEDGLRLFDAMLATARIIAKAVDGRLADEQGGTLSLQRERYMREDVIEFLRRFEVANSSLNEVEDIGAAQ